MHSTDLNLVVMSPISIYQEFCYTFCRTLRSSYSGVVQKIIKTHPKSYKTECDERQIDKLNDSHFN